MGTPTGLHVHSVRYGLVGVVNTLVGLSSILVAKRLFAVADVPANALGYALGLACSFSLNRHWTFAHRGAAGPTLWRFLATQGIAYACNLAEVLGSISANVNAYLAQCAGVPVYMLVGFIGCRYWVFIPERRPWRDP